MDDYQIREMVEDEKGVFVVLENYGCSCVGECADPSKVSFESLHEYLDDLMRQTQLVVRELKRRTDDVE